MTETTRQILVAAVAPIVIVALFVLPGARGLGAQGAPRRGAWRLPVALALPVVVAFAVLYGWPSESWQWIGVTAALGGAVGVAATCMPSGRGTRIAVVLVLAAVTVASLARVLKPESLVHWLLPAAGVLVLAGGLEPLARRRPGPVLIACLALAAGTTSGIVLWSGFLKLSVPVGALATALAAVASVALVRARTISLAGGTLAAIVPVVVVAPHVAWLYASFSGDPLPVWSYVLPAAAPLALWAAEVRAVTKRPAWVGVVARCALVAVPCALAVALALRPAETGSGGEEEDWAEMYESMMP